MSATKLKTQLDYAQTCAAEALTYFILSIVFCILGFGVFGSLLEEAMGEFYRLGIGFAVVLVLGLFVRFLLKHIEAGRIRHALYALLEIETKQTG